jgi:hypothetical protein
LNAGPKEGRGTLARINLPKAEENKITALLDEAQKFHGNGDHAAYVQKANEALETLKKK